MMMSSANTVGPHDVARPRSWMRSRDAARRPRRVARAACHAMHDGLDDDHGAVDDDAEVDRAHREQVRRHAARVQVDERREQRERDERRHDERRAQVEQEDEQHQRDQQRALEQVVAPPSPAWCRRARCGRRRRRCWRPSAARCSLSSFTFARTRSSTRDGFSPRRIEHDALHGVVVVAAADDALARRPADLHARPRRRGRWACRRASPRTCAMSRDVVEQALAADDELLGARARACRPTR